ncbi:kinetochore-associated protein DSN1 homolog isoform X2 [Mustelus asterias]
MGINYGLHTDSDSRLRSSNQNTPLPDQNSSAKGKSAKHQEPGNSDKQLLHCLNTAVIHKDSVETCKTDVTKQEKALQRSSLPIRRSPRLNPGAASASLERDNVSPTSQTKMSPISPAGEPEVSKEPSSNKQLKKSPKSNSWRRSSFKGGKGRKSLPPVHQDTTEICEGIRMDLPEDERLALLFQACSEYTLQKLQRSLEPRGDFSLNSFQTHASSISSDIKRIVETMKLDGTLRKCTEKSDDVIPTPEMELMMKQLKDDISRLNAECKAWDQLLDVYRQRSEAATVDFEKAAAAFDRVLEPAVVMENSQMDVIRTKPDYRRYLNEDMSILRTMECIMDQLQLTMNLIGRARQEWDSCLNTISKQFASRTFQGLERCPVQKFLTAMKQ